MRNRSFPVRAALLRALLAPLALALLLAGLSGPGASAETGSASPAPSSASDPHHEAEPDSHPEERSLADDMVHPEHRVGVLARGVRHWSGRKITFYESIPAKWDWSLTRAIEHWNKSGARIKFVEVASARRADLKISYGYTGGADGMATLGQQSKNWVHLSPAYKKVDETDPVTRVWVGRLFAHELGHVLGFDHTGGCTLMTPVFMMGTGGCKVLSQDQPGYYYCRWIDKALLRRFIDWYGGRASRPPVLCLIEKLPPRLDDVAFAGGGPEGPVRVTWRPMDGARPGTRVVISTWRRTECGDTPPGGAIVDRVAPTAGAWVEPRFGLGEQCYQVRIENRYGAARPGVVHRREQHAPVPEAPVVAGPTWNATKSAWRFTWAAGPHETLGVIQTEPGQCVTTYDPSLVQGANPVGEDGWLVYADRAAACLSFFVVTDWGTVSTATTVEASTPVPDAPQVSLTWDSGSGTWHAAWTSPDPSWRLVVMHGPSAGCPEAYDAAAAEADWPSEVEPGVWEVQPWGVDECLAFAVETGFGQVSPVTQEVVSVPAPTASPVVGEPASGAAGSGMATVTATVPDSAGSLEIRVEVVPGACPQAVPSDAEWRDGERDWYDETLWHLYPDTWGSTEPSCAHFALFDRWDRYGPVVSRSFTAG